MMKKKNMLLACGAAFALVFASPQSMEVVNAKMIAVYDAGTVTEQGYVLAQLLEFPPEWDGGVYNYVAFDPQTIKLINYKGKKVISLTLHELKIKNFKVKYTYQCDIDLYENLYWLEGNDIWRDLTDQRAFIWDDDGSCDFTKTKSIHYIVEYIKENRPEIYQEIMNDIKEKEEKEASAARERLNSQLDAAYQSAQAGLGTLSAIGADVSWETFSSEFVDNSKVPPLSELMGHVFLLSDSYGFKTVRMNDSIVLKTDKRRNALVHFLPIKHPEGYWMICLMDDTGEFAGKDYINRKPIVVRFRSYQEDYGYYKGMDDRFIKTGTFNTLGSVVGGSNLVEGLTHEGFVNIGIEKTDEAGKYHLVYYVTRITWDDYGNQHVNTNKYDGYYATLTLVK